MFSWNPDAPQGWITGFNPDHIGKVDVNKQVMIGSVTFNTKTMYDEFVLNNAERTDVKDYIICDQDNMTVWIMWYELEKI